MGDVSFAKGLSTNIAAASCQAAQPSWREGRHCFEKLGLYFEQIMRLGICARYLFSSIMSCMVPSVSPWIYLWSWVSTNLAMMQKIEILRLSYCRTPAFEMDEPGRPTCCMRSSLPLQLMRTIVPQKISVSEADLVSDTLPSFCRPW